MPSLQCDLNFELGEQKELLRQEIRRLVDRECPRDYIREMDEKEEFPRRVWEKLAEAGYLGIPIDPQYGGVGGDILDMVIVVEEMAKKSASIALTFMMSSCFGAKALAFAGSERQKQELLPRLARGQLMFAISVTEPDGGTDVLNVMKTTARADGDSFILNGAKMWTTCAHLADYMVVYARTNPHAAKKTEGITVFLVDPKTPGVEIRKINKLGIRATSSFAVFYNDVRVPRDNILGRLDYGFYDLLPMLNNERILVAAICLGLAQAAFADALEYAQQRQAFGKPLGQFQAIQHELARTATDIELAKLITYKAAWLQSLGRDCGIEANMAKLVAANAACQAADRGMQILGGYCYSMEFDMQRYWRDARLYRIAPITDEMVLNFIGEKLGLPRSF
ncbi:MAG: acyl-CoA/acyl-ACP dehydrogenase [Candidatus Binatia bacterium]|nr:acyl-CoA/acyl-ACP dehydrogenase [Candidatus Binatia bacterium]